MNLSAIKDILNLDAPESVKESMIITVLSKDKEVIPNLLKVLDAERKHKSELILDMNLELTRSHVYIDEMINFENVKKEANLQVNKKFITDKIAAFYIKYKGSIGHCFNRFND